MSKTKFLELNPIIDEQMVEKYKESFDFVFDNDQLEILLFLEFMVLEKQQY